MRLPRCHPLIVAAVVSIAINVVGLVVFGTSLIDLTVTGLLTLFGAMLTGGAAVFLYLDGELARGESDLVINAVADAVSLPKTMGRQAIAAVPLDLVAAVELDEIESTDSDGQTSYRFAPVLVLDDRAGSQRREKLVEWWDLSAAQEFTGWLREKLQKVHAAHTQAC